MVKEIEVKLSDELYNLLEEYAKRKHYKKRNNTQCHSILSRH
jgi:hypothetical protein